MDVFYVYMYLRSRASKNGPVGSPYYVGKGKGNRAFSTAHRCKPPLDPANITFISTDMTEWDAHQLEMLLINVHGRIDNRTGCLANLTDGGEGQRGVRLSAERKALTSAWMKANPNSGQFTSEPRPWKLGVPLPEAQKAKQSASWTADKRASHSEKMMGNRNGIGNKAGLGRKQSEETRLKRSLSLKEWYAARRTGVISKAQAK